MNAPVFPPIATSWKRFRDRVVDHAFTVDQYHGMIAAGVIGENHRVELLYGRVVEKVAIGTRQSGVVNFLSALFHRYNAVDSPAVVGVQNPITLETSEPEPDITLSRFRDDLYGRSHPTAADVLLVVEVAESSLADDRDYKTPLYAGEGIAEYWIVNLPERCIEVHRDPDGESAYRERRVVAAGESVSPASLPNWTVEVDRLT